mgnify:CR=1 FL=1
MSQIDVWSPSIDKAPTDGTAFIGCDALGDIYIVKYDGCEFETVCIGDINNDSPKCIYWTELPTKPKEQTK